MTVEFVLFDGSLNSDSDMRMLVHAVGRLCSNGRSPRALWLALMQAKKGKIFETTIPFWIRAGFESDGIWLSKSNVAHAGGSDGNGLYSGTLILTCQWSPPLDLDEMATTAPPRCGARLVWSQIRFASKIPDPTESSSILASTENFWARMAKLFNDSTMQ